VIDKRAMSKAIEFGEYFRTTAARLVTKELSDNPLERECKKIVKALSAREGTASTRELMRVTNLVKSHFKAVIETMEERGMVIPVGEKQWKLCEEAA
jgi:predicted transcriptional regulator